MGRSAYPGHSPQLGQPDTPLPPMKLLKTLKAQIAAALTLLILLFAGVSSLSMDTLEEQRKYNTLLNLITRLDHTAQHILSLSMNYAMDKAAYQRDIKLYHQSMMRQVQVLDRITLGFIQQNFPPELTNMKEPFRPSLTPAMQLAISRIDDTWRGFRRGLYNALGEDAEAPQLQRAPRYITSHHGQLTGSIDALMAQMQLMEEEHLAAFNTLFWCVIASAVVTTIGIFAWFFFAVLQPLQVAVNGFKRVSQGDFGLQVPTAYNNEITSLTNSFNHLSSRLHAIFLLIDRIQQGSDMDQTLCFVAEQFPALLPLNWVGALVVAGDNRTITLEHSYADGQQEQVPKTRFRLQQTLLQKALASGEPLHIPDMLRTAEHNPGFQFLNHLTDKGLRDAIFLPITAPSPIPAVLAFATHEPKTYTPEHLELLTNIANLVTHSFGRSVRLAEHNRLAAIGEFASGIAHEIRSPLSTITMALNYLHSIDLEAGAKKRAKLAHQEAERMARLLEEMLLYAKPMQLTLTPLNLYTLLQQLIDTHQAVVRQKHQQLKIISDEREMNILGDDDRMRQVFLNLIRNASEAAPENTLISCSLKKSPQTRTISVAIQNTGPLIPPEHLAKLFEPFFTTKADGVGLGLGVVKRIIDTHGGEIQIESIELQGTTVTVLIPMG